MGEVPLHPPPWESRPEDTVVPPLAAVALPLPLSPGLEEERSSVDPPVGETEHEVMVISAPAPPSAVEETLPHAPPAVIEESAIENVMLTPLAAVCSPIPATPSIAEMSPRGTPYIAVEESGWTKQR